MNQGPSVGPAEWLLGVLGTITLGWVGATSAKVNRHETEIAVIREGQTYIREALERIEDRLDTKPKQ